MRLSLPVIGAVRTRTKFFWWPVRVGNTIYWLERRTVRQRRYDGIMPTLPFCDSAQWLIMEVLR